MGFVGTAYLTLALLIFRYLMGFPEDSSIESSRAANPIDTALLETIWRRLPRPSEKWIPAVRSVSISFCYGLGSALIFVVYSRDE